MTVSGWTEGILHCEFTCTLVVVEDPPFVVPEKGQKKNMVSNLEIGGNIIVSWLVIIVYLDWNGRPSTLDLV